MQRLLLFGRNTGQDAAHFGRSGKQSSGFCADHGEMFILGRCQTVSDPVSTIN